MEEGMDESSYFISSFDLEDYEDYIYNATSSDDYSHSIHVPWRWNFTVTLIMAVFGIVANSALLMVIALNRHLRTVSNILVGNLAVADLIMFIFAVPSDILHWHVFNWPDNDLGDFLCKLTGGSYSLAQALCVASLTAVSIERYCTLRWKIHTKRTAVILFLVWVFAVVCTVPLLVWAKVVKYSRSFSICHVVPVHTRDNPTAKGFLTTGFVLKYLIPLLVITCCYCGMAAVLVRGTPSSTAAVRAMRRLAIVVLVLNIAFAICWLPGHAINLYFLYTSWDQILAISFETYMTLSEVAHVLVYVNSCLNPVVVFAISATHREPLMRFARSCLFCVRQAPPSTGTDQNAGDRYARIPDDVFVTETECAEEKA
ncbi:allatostatin-A receptor-like [Patiria miniata]|uniref:G-protein coupled receptors family 1 profile domain-containing protein n=1 Tax=Patiria miniata TaxID=46514 RepID=A0A914BDK3_PATMI|nr:allatostatin-A receptor-like [Patiria miniata]